MSDQIVSYILQNALPSTLIQVYFRVSSKLFKQFVHSWTIIEWPAPHAHISRSEQMLKCWNPDNAPKNARVFAHLRKLSDRKLCDPLNLEISWAWHVLQFENKTRINSPHADECSRNTTKQKMHFQYSFVVRAMFFRVLPSVACYIREKIQFFLGFCCFFTLCASDITPRFSHFWGQLKCWKIYNKLPFKWRNK